MSQSKNQTQVPEDQTQALHQILDHALSQDHPYPLSKMLTRFRQSQDPSSKGTTQKDRYAAVLVAFAWHHHQPCLLLGKRSLEQRSHAGQIVFPGGVIEEGETHREAAIREFTEETGVSTEQLQVIGELPKIYTFSSRFWVTPVLGHFPTPADQFDLMPEPAELQSLFWIPFEFFTNPENKKTHRVRGLDTPAYDVQSTLLWGATAMILENLAQRVTTAQSELNQFLFAT